MSVAHKVRVLPENQSCCSTAGDGTFCVLCLAQGTLLHGSGFTAGCFTPAPVVSTAGRSEIGQVPLYKATEPLTLACSMEFKILILESRASVIALLEVEHGKMEPVMVIIC